MSTHFCRHKKCSLFGVATGPPSRCIGLLAGRRKEAPLDEGDPLWQLAWRKTAASRSPSGCV